MSKLADILSIIAFFITVYTFIKVWKNTQQLKELNKKNLFINRLPENLNDLKKSSFKISQLSSKLEENRESLLIEISILSPILKSLKKSLKKKDLQHYNLLMIEVNKHRNTFISKENVPWLKKFFNYYNLIEKNYVSKVYRYLTTLITDIENIDKDFKKDLLR